MTVIIGLKHENVVYMGADSAIHYTYQLGIGTQPKVFWLPQSEMLVGNSGSLRHRQIVQYHCDMELDLKSDALSNLVTHFVPHVRAMLKEHGATQTENGKDVSDGSWLLLAYRQRLFRLEGNFQVVELAGEFDAIGSGAELALGAMAALDRVLLPQARVQRALEITAQFSPSVAAPFVVLNTKDAG